MTMGNNFGLQSCAQTRAECEHTFRIRLADSHLFSSDLPRFVAAASVPLAETGQLYPDEDSARDA
jgi:hypothetical protein